MHGSIDVSLMYLRSSTNFVQGYWVNAHRAAASDSSGKVANEALEATKLGGLLRACAPSISKRPCQQAAASGDVHALREQLQPLSDELVSLRLCRSRGDVDAVLLLSVCRKTYFAVQ